MQVEIGDHAPIDEFAPNEVAGQINALRLTHLAWKSEFDLPGKLGVLADFERLDIVPEPFAVAPGLRRVLPAQLAEAILDVADAQLKHFDGLGVAHCDDPAAFDFLHLLLREPLVGPLLERSGGRLPVLVELLLGARVFAFLEQVFGLVALAPRVGERERAILAVAVRADGIGFLTGAEAVAHPPEFRSSVAGPALVRRDEEIKAATGHVGNLGGAPRAVVEFRAGGAAVDVGPDLLGVGARAIVLCGPSAQFPSSE